MSIFICLTTFLALFTMVQPLNILPVRRTDDFTSRKTIVDVLLNYLSNTRRSGMQHKDLAKTKLLFKKLSQNMGLGNIKKILRDTDKSTDKYNIKVVEMELKDALASKHSALLDRPYVQKKGRNDFLVFRPEVVDPYVTIIPNAIYYNLEKKCVNWLDDCSINGIRDRLLKGVNSPYK